MREFHAMRSALLERVRDWPDVESLVWAGSAADTDRADEWSDLDFFLIVRSGRQESFRRSLEWLPDADGIALSPRETAHGVKVVYDDGFVLEFAVFDRSELAQSTVNHHALAFGDEQVRQTLQAIHRPDGFPSPSTPEDHLGLALALLVIGLGRDRRGEHLVAGQAIRAYAVAHVLQAAHGLLPSRAPQARDRLDPWRRAEAEFPELAADLRVAVALPNAAAALSLAECIERHFGAHSQVPARGRAVLRRRFN